MSWKIAQLLLIFVAAKNLSTFFKPRVKSLKIESTENNDVLCHNVDEQNEQNDEGVNDDEDEDVLGVGPISTGLDSNKEDETFITLPSTPGPSDISQSKIDPRIQPHCRTYP